MDLHWRSTTAGLIFFIHFFQSDKFYRNASLLDSGNVPQTAALLANATSHTEKYYGSDVKVAYRLTRSLLQHESNQQGFNLTATQDVHFTEVNTLELRLTGAAFLFIYVSFFASQHS